LAFWHGYAYLAVWHGYAYTPGLHESALYPTERSADDKPYASNLREAWRRSLQGPPLKKKPQKNQTQKQKKRGAKTSTFFLKKFEVDKGPGNLYRHRTFYNGLHLTH
jgi:hypothetical protein